jgi:transcriptional regulator with AAA-type ATPase domain
MALKKIPPSYQDFCDCVASATFSNPFDPKRRNLYSKIIGRAFKPGDEMDLRALVEAVEKVRISLSDAGILDYRKFRATDAEKIRMLVLFGSYHRMYALMDEHIENQLRAPGKSILFKPGKECINFLCQSGFSEEESVWYVGVFYQVRRAYYFISRNLIGSSPCMHAFKRRLWNNVFTHDIGNYETCMWDRMEEFSVLLVGETGTGKGSAASALGHSGFVPYDFEKNRFAFDFQDAFVAVNLSQYSQNLLESELFGHRKGAFTGALADYDGLFARCRAFGAVFLDEIGDVPLTAQIKLLRLLQEREYSPVGGRQILNFRGRVIAAANPSIDQYLMQGEFRHDFYYRLCSDRIELPTLRQRIAESPQELEDVVHHMIRKITGMIDRGLKSMVMEVLKRLGGHDWPGNVRELEQAIRQILMSQQYCPLKGAEESVGKLDAFNRQMKDGTLTASELLSGYASHLYESNGSYETVSKIMNVDRRTVKKYLK